MTHDAIAVAVPAIVDLETYRAAQARRTQSRELRRRAPKYDYLLAGRLRCVCGYAIGPKARRDTRTRLNYDCAARNEGAGANLRKCDVTIKHAKEVDEIVWKWVRSLLIDEEVLTAGLRDYQARSESDFSPLRERLAVTDGLLIDARAQLAKLLDLYLARDFPRDLLVERKSRLQDTIGQLEAERKHIQARLEADSLTDRQIRSLQDFVAKVGEGPDGADEVFAERRRLIDLLDVTGVFGVENGRDVIDVSCVIADQRLSLLSINS